MNNLVLHGFNKSSTGVDYLIACHDGSMKVLNVSTNKFVSGSFPYINATNNIGSVNFLDHAMFTNYLTNFSFDGTDWSDVTNVLDMPLGKYLETQGLRVFVGNVKIRGTAYPSRVAYSNLPNNNEVVWGFETGTNLVQTTGSAVVTSVGSLFITRAIQIGDPLFIENGTNAGQYTVESIDSETQITLTDTLSNTATSNFWVSSNWFDVMTDDGDFVNGFGKNSNELLVFKRNSLHRFNSTAKTLRQVKQVKGTTSPKSIVNCNEYTYYFYPNVGILRYNGTTSSVISEPLDDIITGITSSMYTEVVGWSVDDKKVEFYVGDVTLKDGDTVSKCVISFDLTMETWSTRSLPWGIEQKTTWYNSGIPNTYISNTLGQVLKVDDGYTYNSSAISFQLEDKVLFPVDSNTLVDFKRLILFVENGEDIQVLCKLYYKPTLDSNRWINDKDWLPLSIKGNGEKIEIIFPSGFRACGIQFKFIQSSSRESFLLEKYIIYYSNPSAI